MAEERDELNMRRRKREELRQKQLRERRRLRIALIAAAVILLACAGGIVYFARSARSGTGSPAPTQATQQTRPTQTEATQETSASRKQNTKTVIHLRAAGDLNITNSVVEAGLAATGYDFTRAFMDVAPVLAGADLKISWRIWRAASAATPTAAPGPPRPGRFSRDCAAPVWTWCRPPTPIPSSTASSA